MKYVPPYGTTSPNPDSVSYINGDPSIGRQGSIPPAAVFENPQREIVNLIDDSQQTPADQDLHQLTRGVRDGKLNFCVDSGPLNQLQIVLPGPPLQSYTAGLIVNILVAHTNTGPVRIVIGTLNPTSLKRRDGSELQPNDILAGMIATCACDGTYFQLINMEAQSPPGPPTTIMIDIPYVHDTSVNANRVIGLYSPPLVDIREGRTVEVKLANNVTGPTTFIPNNFPEHPVAHPDGTPIKAGDGVINQIWLLCFDGAQWQLLGVYFTVPVVPPTVPSVATGKSLKLWYRQPDQNSHLRQDSVDQRQSSGLDRQHVLSPQRSRDRGHQFRRLDRAGCRVSVLVRTSRCDLGRHAERRVLLRRLHAWKTGTTTRPRSSSPGIFHSPQIRALDRQDCMLATSRQILNGITGT